MLYLRVCTIWTEVAVCRAVTLCFPVIMSWVLVSLVFRVGLYKNKVERSLDRLNLGNYSENHIGSWGGQ